MGFTSAINLKHPVIVQFPTQHVVAKSLVFITSLVSFSGIVVSGAAFAGVSLAGRVVLAAGFVKPLQALIASSVALFISQLFSNALTVKNGADKEAEIKALREKVDELTKQKEEAAKAAEKATEEAVNKARIEKDRQIDGIKKVVQDGLSEAHGIEIGKLKEQHAGKVTELSTKVERLEERIKAVESERDTAIARIRAAQGFLNKDQTKITNKTGLIGVLKEGDKKEKAAVAKSEDSAGKKEDAVKDKTAPKDAPAKKEGVADLISLS